MDTAELLTELQLSPPQSHPAAPTGAWAAEGSCLAFLADVVQPHWTTLETGCGASTAVFAHKGSSHTSVSLEASEGDAVRKWCDEHEVSTSNLNLVAGSSTVELPKMEATPLDLVFIDGCHAYPFPTVDWYYSAPRIREGGVLVVDDLQLPAPNALADFLRADPRWATINDTPRWGAWVRLIAEPLDEEWTSQPFYDEERYNRQLNGSKPQPYQGQWLRRRAWLLAHPRELGEAVSRRVRARKAH